MVISLNRHGLFSRGCVLGVILLDGGHTDAQLYRNTIRFQDQLQFGYQTEKIDDIEIAQVSDAENLARHFRLSIGNDGAESLAEFLDDGGGAQPWRRFDSGDRSAGVS